MADAVTVRSAAPEDREAILALVGEAFSHGGHDSRQELDIVRASWASGRVAEGLDLVAVPAGGGGVVGHVLGAWGDLGGRAVVGVAPLAVAPAHQGGGIASTLMREVLRRADEVRCPLVVLLGDPAFYGRFGFEAAGRHGVVYPPVGPGDPHFMARWWAGVVPGYRGEFRYCWEL
ncbi:MAG TPA: N-acetyltransferase [Acidimicrobiales bacterium]|nr:N-acetyltransferase [Acidimicrobiales bacterium]